MKLNVFIYIASNFLILQLVSLESNIINQIIYSICGLGILTLGISHGAIDNILYGVQSRISNLNFLLKYVVIIVIVAILWLLLPNFAFVIFIAVSAYHFGQSQFAEYDSKPLVLSKIVFFSWGSIVLFMMFYFNQVDLRELQLSFLKSFPILDHFILYSSYYLIGSVVIFSFSFLLSAYLNKLSIQALIEELYILLLIACSMFFLPFLIAFSLFFIWIHSFRVIIQEFDFCKQKLETKTHGEFIKLFMPLTSISLAGMFLILFIAFRLDKVEFIPHILLVLLSCITIPHSFVMEKFYSFVVHSGSR